ncbi:MAG: hypothetical protein IID39_08315 [Planctomycetes bacterium]|nr:hypothetical protein [Planctomycetota bacterium]
MGGNRQAPIAGMAAGIALLGCAVWYVPDSPRRSPAALPVHEDLQIAGLGCGPAALTVVASACDANAATVLRDILQHHRAATSPVSSFYNLAAWAKQVGLAPIGVKVEVPALSQLALPAIVHVTPDHFLVLAAVNKDRVVVTEQGAATREIPRREFDRRFSGYMLCLRLGRAELGQSL